MKKYDQSSKNLTPNAAAPSPPPSPPPSRSARSAQPTPSKGVPKKPYVPITTRTMSAPISGNPSWAAKQRAAQDTPFSTDPTIEKPQNITGADGEFQQPSDTNKNIVSKGKRATMNMTPDNASQIKTNVFKSDDSNATPPENDDAAPPLTIRRGNKTGVDLLRAKLLNQIDKRQKLGLDENSIYEDAKGHKNPTGGLTKKGRDYYNRKHGSNLKAPVTTPPSELKAGSKSANRRKSFCARMGGVEGPKYKPNGEPTRKTLALRKWNCEEVEINEKTCNCWDGYKRVPGTKPCAPGSCARPSAILRNSQTINESEDGQSKIGKTPGHMVSMEQPWHPEDPNAGHRKTFQKKMEKEQKEREKMQERYEGAEKTSKDFRKPNSRFVGSDELTKVYADMTPKESTLTTIKRVIAEDKEEIKALQNKLIKAGAKITADGFMGPSTQAAMKKFPSVSVAKQPLAATPQQKEFSKGFGTFVNKEINRLTDNNAAKEKQNAPISLINPDNKFPWLKGRIYKDYELGEIPKDQPEIQMHPDVFDTHNALGTKPLNDDPNYNSKSAKEARKISQQIQQSTSVPEPKTFRPESQATLPRDVDKFVRGQLGLGAKGAPASASNPVEAPAPVAVPAPNDKITVPKTTPKTNPSIKPPGTGTKNTKTPDPFSRHAIANVSVPMPQEYKSPTEKDFPEYGVNQASKNVTTINRDPEFSQDAAKNYANLQKNIASQPTVEVPAATPAPVAVAAPAPVVKLEPASAPVVKATPPDEANKNIDAAMAAYVKALGPRAPDNGTVFTPGEEARQNFQRAQEANKKLNPPPLVKIQADKANVPPKIADPNASERRSARQNQFTDVQRQNPIRTGLRRAFGIEEPTDPKDLEADAKKAKLGSEFFKGNTTTAPKNDSNSSVIPNWITKAASKAVKKAYNTAGEVGSSVVDAATQKATEVGAEIKRASGNIGLSDRLNDARVNAETIASGLGGAAKTIGGVVSRAASTAVDAATQKATEVGAGIQAARARRLANTPKPPVSPFGKLDVPAIKKDIDAEKGNEYESGGKRKPIKEVTKNTINELVARRWNKFQSESYINENMHTVKSGDSFDRIAKTYNLNPANLISLNPQIRNPDIIQPGQQIKLAQGVTSTSTLTPKVNSKSETPFSTPKVPASFRETEPVRVEPAPPAPTTVKPAPVLKTPEKLIQKNDKNVTTSNRSSDFRIRQSVADKFEKLQMNQINDQPTSRTGKSPTTPMDLSTTQVPVTPIKVEPAKPKVSVPMPLQPNQPTEKDFLKTQVATKTPLVPAQVKPATKPGPAATSNPSLSALTNFKLSGPAGVTGKSSDKFSMDPSISSQNYNLGLSDKKWKDVYKNAEKQKLDEPGPDPIDTTFAKAFPSNREAPISPPDSPIKELGQQSQRGYNRPGPKDESIAKMKHATMRDAAHSYYGRPISDKHWKTILHATHAETDNAGTDPQEVSGIMASMLNRAKTWREEELRKNPDAPDTDDYTEKAIWKDGAFHPVTRAFKDNKDGQSHEFKKGPGATRYADMEKAIIDNLHKVGRQQQDFTARRIGAYKPGGQGLLWRANMLKTGGPTYGGTIFRNTFGKDPKGNKIED